MNNQIFNRTAFLRTSRNFPEEMHQLTVEVNKSYVDIANAVNVRTIGFFPSSSASITGESWFIFKNERQQSFRQVYTFTSTANIAHGITVSQISQFVRCWGTFTDGTNSFGLIFGSNVAIAGQISFFINPTNIVFLTGAGAPALTSGTIVLEWLSLP